jgi:hypothetical protein
MEVSVHVLFQDIVPTFSWCESSRHAAQDGLYPGGDLNPKPPEYETIFFKLFALEKYTARAA